MSALDINNSILGLFPALDSLGGVQASGRLAWEGVARQSCSRGSLLFCYGEGVRERPGLAFSPYVYAPSKLRAIISAFKIRQPVSRILIWHIGLLKLLPCFRARDAKVILFLHGIEAWRKQDRVTSRVLRRVDLFLSNSDYTWQRFIQANPNFASAQHLTVHLGIESEMKEDVPGAGDPPAVLMTSRLLKSEGYKGHREMIQAWPEVLKRIPEAELWVCGDGDLKVDLERQMAEIGVGPKVRFFGRISEEEKVELLARSRCFALPSRGEGFGLVYLEAMRVGRPCLVSTEDAGYEVVNPPEAGLAVDVSCPEEITAAVCRLLEPSSGWEQMCLRARRRYAEFFTAEHFQRRLNAALSTF